MTMTENGHIQPKRKAVELLLDSGVRVFVTPLSPFTRQQLVHDLHEQYPDPNPSDYETQIPGQSSPGAVFPADDPNNPKYEAYIKAKTDAETTRNNHYVLFLIRHKCHFPDYPDIVAAFKDELEKLRGAVSLPVNEWEAVVAHLVITSGEDRLRILDAAHGNLMLIEPDPTEDDVHSAWRIFRPDVQRETLKRLAEYTRRLSQGEDLRH